MSDQTSAGSAAEVTTGPRFKREIGLGANVSLGFTYMSPLVGIFSLLPLALTTVGPPAVWWIVAVGCGQMLVALTFGEIVSQYPIAGGLYPWARRLWNRQFAWIVAWIYMCAVVLTITSVAEYSPSFVSSLFGFELTPGRTLLVAVVMLLIAFGFNMGGTKMLSRVTRLGFAAELIGVVVVGLYLLLFERKNSFDIFVTNSLDIPAEAFLTAFFLAALTGLYLFYGFEACGDIAEEVDDPERRIPIAMILTIVVGGCSALLAFVGFIMAAPNLPDILAGKVADPVGDILGSSVGTVGAKVFIVIGLTAFISCMLSLQAALSRTIFSFGRDRMLPRGAWLSQMSAEHPSPRNAMMVACLLPIAFCLWIYFYPDGLYRFTAFAVAGIYLAFQLVVFAALRQRLRGWRPGGPWSLGRKGIVINVAALAYGLASLFVLARPGDAGLAFLDRWIVLIGLAVVVGLGLLYMVVARPYGRSTAPEGDAIELAARLRAERERV